MGISAALPNQVVRCGDSLTLLRAMPTASVHMAVCSPPYFGLRDYKCDGQIGLEPTPAEYVAKLVELFGELWRVMRDDGTLWVNIGDSYAGYWGDAKAMADNRPSAADGHGFSMNARPKFCDAFSGSSIKPKDRIGIPHRFAFAMQDAGWYWRDEIVWAKRSPMPESVTDRTTKAHEFVFMFSKQERYFYDAVAIREPASSNPVTSARRKRTDNGVVGRKELHGDFNGQSGKGFNSTTKAQEFRNKRSVWSLSSEPFRGGHFACYPTKLVTPCILAGTSAYGVCAACGAPWVRVTNKSKRRRERPNALTKRGGEAGTGNFCPNDVAGVAVETTGWRPSCECGAGVVPATVLDPFSGAATTGVVCIRTGRSYIGLELNPEYVALSEERLRVESHKFNQDGPDSLFSTLNASSDAVQSASEVVYANH